MVEIWVYCGLPRKRGRSKIVQICVRLCRRHIHGHERRYDTIGVVAELIAIIAYLPVLYVTLRCNYCSEGELLLVLPTYQAYELQGLPARFLKNRVMKSF